MEGLPVDVVVVFENFRQKPGDVPESGHDDMLGRHQVSELVQPQGNIHDLLIIGIDDRQGGVQRVADDGAWGDGSPEGEETRGRGREDAGLPDGVPVRIQVDIGGGDPDGSGGGDPQPAGFQGLVVGVGRRICGLAVTQRAGERGVVAVEIIAQQRDRPGQAVVPEELQCDFCGLGVVVEVEDIQRVAEPVGPEFAVGHVGEIIDRALGGDERGGRRDESSRQHQSEECANYHN